MWYFVSKKLVIIFLNFNNFKCKKISNFAENLKLQTL